MSVSIFETVLKGSRSSGPSSERDRTSPRCSRCMRPGAPRSSPRVAPRTGQRGDGRGPVRQGAGSPRLRVLNTTPGAAKVSGRSPPPRNHGRRDRPRHEPPAVFCRSGSGSTRPVDCSRWAESSCRLLERRIEVGYATLLGLGRAGSFANSSVDDQHRATAPCSAHVALTEPSNRPTNPPCPRLPSTNIPADLLSSMSVDAAGPATSRVVSPAGGVSPNASMIACRCRVLASSSGGQSPRE